MKDDYTCESLCSGDSFEDCTGNMAAQFDLVLSMNGHDVETVVECGSVLISVTGVEVNHQIICEIYYKVTRSHHYPPF